MMHRRLKSTGKAEGGAVAIIVAVLITVFIGFLAIVVDVGYMYEMRRQLQSAADAGALAAMTQKINGDDPVSEARAYATMNDLVGTPVRSDILDMANSDFDEQDYVVVAVQKPANLFFAPLFFGDSQMITAKARANRVWVTGVKGLVPWGFATMKAQAIEANVSGSWYPLSAVATDTYEESLPVPATPAADGYPVGLKLIYNSSYAEEFPNIGRIMVDVPDDEVSDVWLSVNTLSPGQSTTLYVQSSAPPRISNQPFSSADFSEVSSGLYKTTLTAPEIANPLESYPIQVKVGPNNFANAAVLVVRKSNSPVDTIEIGNSHWQPSGGGSVLMTVGWRDLEPDVSYELKLADGRATTAGNFNLLDFRDITHEDGTPEGLSSANEYGGWLAEGYPQELHINDTIATLTGGQSTKLSLKTRFDGCELSYDDWKLEKPADCGRLVTVPIIELYTDLTGSSPESYAKVVAFAVFFINSDPNDNLVTGTFVEYAQTGTYQEDRPDSSFVLETVRLDYEGIY
ncbi:MAG: pilus assembly protein TadG-related protein [Actinomycetota bacterium]|nr:pilus assembly protein TadG-related protein [Actinomycetota bacterium]